MEESINKNDQRTVLRLLLSPLLRWFLLLITLGLSLVAIVSVLSGLFEESGRIAAVASAFATILLVSLTAQYAQLTQALVRESRRTREEELRQRNEEKRRELNSLRRALKEEIGTVAYLEHMAEEYSPGQSVSDFVAPTTVYEANTDKIGMLTDKEIDLIVEFYTRVELVEDLHKVQRDLHTTIGEDVLTGFFKDFEAYMDYWLWKVSFGYLGSDERIQLTRNIEEQYEELARAQEEAISALEENIDSEQ